MALFDDKLSSQLAERSIGENSRDGYLLNLYEACMLVEEKKLDVYDADDKKLGVSDLMHAGLLINPSFLIKYEVFKDLRLGRGYIVRPGIKFGSDFAVYARGKKPGKSHSKWMVHVIEESAKTDYVELTRAARLAANVKKMMVFATVTDRGPVYYEFSRIKL